MLKRHISVTKDGSHTLVVPELNEQYHSIHGAIQESEHVFLKMGLDYQVLKGSISVLEVGFGTGLNALLSAYYAERNNKSIHYVSLEKYPVTTEEAALLNYGKLMQMEDVFHEMHNASWGECQQITELFDLTKLNVDLLDFEISGKYDVIFFDAFAPNKQAEMWSVEVFQKLFEVVENGGCLVTYCCQGQAKRNMAAAGFKVEKVQGPPGKREMLRAIK